MGQDDMGWDDIGQIHRYMDGWMDGWMEGLMDICIHTSIHTNLCMVRCSMFPLPNGRVFHPTVNAALGSHSLTTRPSLPKYSQPIYLCTNQQNTVLLPMYHVYTDTYYLCTTCMLPTYYESPTYNPAHKTQTISALHLYNVCARLSILQDLQKSF